MLGQLGLPGVTLILVVCLVAFGSKNLPSVGKSLGDSLREFKSAISGEEKHQKEAVEDTQLLEERKEI